MNALLTLIPLAASLLSVNAPEALPDKEPPVEETAARIEISVCDADETPDFNYDETDPKRKEKPRFPIRRPQPRTLEERVTDADVRYKEMKKELDENFKIMFQLKAELDATQTYMSAKWEEYYTLLNEYNSQLQKIVGAWVTDTLY